MAAKTKISVAKPPADGAEHDPYVPANVQMPEFTWTAVLLGAILGIIFGASSLYLVLKVGITVSASIPVAVMSITLFRLFSRTFGIRQATILENNIVQTTGSAGESIAFGLGVTVPALLLLGFEMHVVRIITVAVLGGLLGILMMIPLRRAFIVKQHGKLLYPEGSACAEVLIVGEEGGATAKTVFAGFGVAFVHKFLMNAMHVWKDTPIWPIKGLNKGVIGGELSPELLGVGYIIGPRIASVMVAGGVLSSLVLVPTIALFGQSQSQPLAPATQLIRDMSPDELHSNYILYIGAGAVATGGIISMIQALPLIFASIRSGLSDLRSSKSAEGAEKVVVPRTDQDLSIWVVVFGSVFLMLALAGLPAFGLGFDARGFLGAALIIFFGFLFVTVSARLTGEIGSSSNPISGMTVATLLFTCMVFLLMGHTDKAATLTALTVAAVVCIAASNGGTTAQDLKTGYLVGSTPRLQQLAILIGALTSALVIGGTLLLLNNAGTIYTKKIEYLPRYIVPDVSVLKDLEQPGGQYANDNHLYHVLNLAEGEVAGVPQGKYLVADNGMIAYYVDPAINGRLKYRDDGVEVANKFKAPKTRLMAIIISGILNQRLPWGLVILGVLIAITLELAGVPSLPFAVGVYLPIESSVPIFIGGLVRWGVDKFHVRPASESESSPAVLFSSGYIAGGSIAGVVVGIFAFMPDGFNEFIDISHRMHGRLDVEHWPNWPTVMAFSVLVVLLILVGLGKLLNTDESERS